eukprot:1252091-Amphidinium_carterae.2
MLERLLFLVCGLDGFASLAVINSQSSNSGWSPRPLEYGKANVPRSKPASVVGRCHHVRHTTALAVWLCQSSNRTSGFPYQAATCGITKVNPSNVCN